MVQETTISVAALDFGEIIYFLILIIGAAYSLYQKNKPKQQSQRQTRENPAGETETETQQEASSPYNDIERYLRNLTGEQKKETHQPEPLESTRQPTADSLEQSVTEYQFKDDFASAQNEAQKPKIKEPGSGKNIKADPEVSYYLNNMKKSLTLQDMVIANAIYNRPYD